MSRIFLLSSNVATDPYPVYPLGMAVIAAALQNQGHEVRQFDLLASDGDEETLVQALNAFRPDYVGLSLRNIDNVDSFSSDDNWYLAGARQLVARIKTCCAVPVIVGGPAFSIMPREILNFLGADYGVVGEGEQLVPQLISALQQGRAVEPLQQVDEPLAGAAMSGPLLVPEYVEFYQRHSGMINLQTKRGCPYRCVYCTYPALEGHRFRPRDPAAVVDDMLRMQRDHQTDHLFFTDSVFNDRQGLYLQLVEEMLRRALKLRWCAFFRPQGLTPDILRLLKRSGLYAMELGTDAGCDRTLAGFDKGFTFAEALACHRAAVAEEIPCAHFIMFGGPEETPDTVRESLSNIEQIEQGVVFAFSGIRILPKSRLLERAIADGVVAADVDLLKPVYYFSPQVDPEWMNAQILASFAGRRDRIFPPAEGQAKMAVMNNFGFKGILWDQLIRFGAPQRSRRRRATRS
ncbi:MAG: lipid biosynthesis B12-binding/radical SAM protein [Desulfuromonadaceae bacterium]|nr:lipid biosynthesis B12-binding/radical SAM protein [Desulfuromonadaceae bacterium]